MTTFDCAIIGAGPGGYVAAIRAAQLGLKTALIEKNATLGGTCLNVGCIPSKALLEASEHYHDLFGKVNAFGIKVNDAAIDIAAMLGFKAGVVSELTGGLVQLMKKNGVSVFWGAGKLKGGKTIEVTKADGVETIEAAHIVLATGSEAVNLPFMPFDGDYIVSSTEALSFERVPKHLIVVGAGAVGLELGSVWRRLGAEVTVVELLPRIVPFADVQLSQTLAQALKKQGMALRLETQVMGARIENGEAVVSVKDKKGVVEELRADKVLVAVGRRAFSKGLGLEAVGLETDKGGRVQVNERYETAVPGLFAIGDLIAGPMLAHKAEEEGVAVAEFIAGQKGHVNYAVIPNIVYTHPELAAVGLTEAEAKEAGHEVNVGKYYYKPNGRAKSLAEGDGLVKIVADAATDKLLGVHIVGARASDLIAEAALALELGATSEQLARTCHAHPTLSEIVKEAALAVHKRAIHG